MKIFSPHSDTETRQRRSRKTLNRSGKRTPAVGIPRAGGCRQRRTAPPCASAPCPRPRLSQLALASSATASYLLERRALAAWPSLASTPLAASAHRRVAGTWAYPTLKSWVRHCLTSNSVASTCSTPVPLVSAAAAAASIRERKPEEFLPVEHQHRIQELEEKLQVANIAAREEAFSEREAGMRALARPPRLPVSLFAPEPAPDTISDSELSSTASGRVSFRPILHHGDTPKFRLRLSISKAPAHAKAQRHLFNPNQNMVRKLQSDFRAWDAEAERVRSFTPAVIITFDLDPRGADHERAYTIYTSDSFHIGPVESALRAIPLGGYDVSLDDDPESGFTHLDAPLDRAFGRDGQAIAAAAARRTDAVGAAGGGLLPWVAAVGSALTFVEAASNDATSPPTTCSTDCPAAGHCFLYGTCYIPFRSTLGPAIVVIQDVAEHNQPRYFTANLAHAYSVDGAAVQLCSATIATHAVQRVSEGIFAQNLVQLRQPWPPPMEFACLGNGVEPSLLFGFTQGVMVPKPPWPPPQSNGLSPWLYACWAVKCEVCGVIKRLQQVTSSGLSCASNFVVEFQLPIPRTIFQSVVFCEELLKDNSASFQYHNCRKSVLWIQLTSPWLPPIQVSIRDGCTLFHHAVHLECLQGIHLISASAMDIGFIQSKFSGCSCQWVHTDGHILATELHMVNSVTGSELQVCYTNEVLLLVGKVSNGVALFGPVSDVQEVPVVFGTLAKHIISEILWPPVQFEQADGVQFSHRGSYLHWLNSQMMPLMMWVMMLPMRTMSVKLKILSLLHQLCRMQQLHLHYPKILEDNFPRRN